MRDDDGGLSLISAGIRAVTKADEKQDQLQREILEVQNRLLQLARAWVVDPDANLDRDKRIAAARKVLDWLLEDPDLVYHRVYALRETICVKEGDELALADCVESGKLKHGDVLARHVRAFLHDWATTSVPKRWQQFIAVSQEGQPWLHPNDVNAFARYLSDYLLSDHAFPQLCKLLAPVVNLKTKDEAARRRARRKYTRIILNDFVMNPGSSQTPIASPDVPAEEEPKAAVEPLTGYGLMAPLLSRWESRLPQSLGLGAGEHIEIPPGNCELIQILEPFEK